MATFPVRLLSIVVPCYKEQKTIRSTLTNLISSLNKLKIKYEIICVIDGFVDNTYAQAKKVKSPKVKVLAYEHNMGKGHAVRFGLKNAKGDIVGFIDANGISISSIEMLLHHFFLYSADIIIASKRHPVSMVNYPTIRRVISGVNQISQKILFGLNISDTQVGLKLFKSKVVKSLLPKVIINDWIFDVEFLAVANHLGFKRIYESPVRLEAEASKLTSAVFSKGLFKAIFRSAFDILVLYFHLKVTRFYDRPHNTKPLAN